MTQLFYTILIHCYKALVHLASLFNIKAKHKISGISESKIRIANKKNNPKDSIFIHCASQGEHEQISPIIRWILKHTSHHVYLSFYSPSGYRNTNYAEEKRVSKFYLPFDTPEEMKMLFSSLNPSKVIIVKNEWWWNMLSVLNKMKIESYLVSSTIRPQHYFIRYSLSFFKKGMEAFSSIFVVDEESRIHLSRVYDSPVIVSGDTRIDQVSWNKTKNKFDTNTNPKETIVYGSVWPSDLDSIIKIISLMPDANHLIYPHELTETTIQSFNLNIKTSSIVNKYDSNDDGIFIIAEMGRLKYAYTYATLAYIGGGFGAGIHNVLEAAVYAIPTIFGPNHQKSNEAKDLVKRECAFSYHSPDELNLIINNIKDRNQSNRIESKLNSYFSPAESPSEIICQNIFRKFENHV